MKHLFQIISCVVCGKSICEGWRIGESLGLWVPVGGGCPWSWVLGRREVRGVAAGEIATSIMQISRACLLHSRQSFIQFISLVLATRL